MPEKRKRSNNKGGPSPKRRRVNFAVLPNEILRRIARHATATYYSNRYLQLANIIRQVRRENPFAPIHQIRNMSYLSAWQLEPTHAEINHVMQVLRARNEV